MQAEAAARDLELCAEVGTISKGPPVVHELHAFPAGLPALASDLDDAEASTPNSDYVSCSDTGDEATPTQVLRQLQHD